MEVHLKDRSRWAPQIFFPHDQTGKPFPKINFFLMIIRAFSRIFTPALKGTVLLISIVANRWVADVSLPNASVELCQEETLESVIVPSCSWGTVIVHMLHRVILYHLARSSCYCPTCTYRWVIKKRPLFPFILPPDYINRNQPWHLISKICLELLGS